MLNLGCLRSCALAAPCVFLAASGYAQPAAPPNDQCAQAQVIGAGQSYEGTNWGATSDLGASSCSLNDQIDVWYRFTAPVAGSYAFSVTSPNWVLDTTVSVRTDCVGAQLACNDDADPFLGTDSLATVSLGEGQSVVIRVAGYDEGVGPFSIRVSDPPPPPVTGACCCGSVCLIMSQAACTSAYQSFVGPGSTCNAVNNNRTPCCRCDYNRDGRVSTNDLFGFVNGWFEGEPYTRFRGMPDHTVDDVHAYLNAWFAGC